MDWHKTPLCPLDGRYAKRVHELRQFFSEEALMRARAHIEIEYLIALSNVEEIYEFPKLSQEETRALRIRIQEMDEADFLSIRNEEARINHDVKAVEYWLREKCQRHAPSVPLEFIHFGLTSEDVTNLAYGILIHRALDSCIIPEIKGMTSDLRHFVRKTASISMLSMTHGQPATPSAVGDQIQVFLDRLQRVSDPLQTFRMNGKLGGAVGNLHAHHAAYPEVTWYGFAKEFVESLGLEHVMYTTQINPHDDLAQLSHIMIQVNTILLDLARDMWLYISRGIFAEKTKEGEVGSSTMPHKVNPIDWENAEGNLGISTALFSHFAQKLPVSRMQRDLSDSTVQRWLGCAFGEHLLSVKSCRKGLRKLQLNEQKIHEELAAHPEVFTEAIQTVMRRFGYEDAYERVKEFTRGKHITVDDLEKFVDSLNKVPLPFGERLKRILTEYQ